MMEDRILNEVLLSMIVDLPCILKSLLWVEGGKDLGGGGRGKKRRGSGRKHKIQPPPRTSGFPWASPQFGVEKMGAPKLGEILFWALWGWAT